MPVLEKAFIPNSALRLSLCASTVEQVHPSAPVRYFTGPAPYHVRSKQDFAVLGASEAEFVVKILPEVTLLSWYIVDNSVSPAKHNSRIGVVFFISK